MKRFLALFLITLTFATAQAAAEEIIVARSLRAGEKISAAHLVTPQTPGGLRRAAAMIGKEAERNLYKGKTISEIDIRRPRLIHRNAIITMTYKKGPMLIEVEAQALDEGGKGERIRVLNLQSKRTVTAEIIAANHVRAQ